MNFKRWNLFRSKTGFSNVKRKKHRNKKQNSSRYLNFAHTNWVWLGYLILVANYKFGPISAKSSMKLFNNLFVNLAASSFFQSNRLTFCSQCSEFLLLFHVRLELFYESMEWKKKTSFQKRNWRENGGLEGILLYFCHSCKCSFGTYIRS